MAEKRQCAIYGVRNGSKAPNFEENMQKLKEKIDEQIEAGVLTFVVSEIGDYELTATKYIVEKKSSNENIHLILVKPYEGVQVSWRRKQAVEEVTRAADYIKYIAKNPDEYHSWLMNKWIVTNCCSLICITSSSQTNIRRLKYFNLDGKNIIHIPERTSKQNPNTGYAYPYPIMLVCDIFQVDAAEIDNSSLPNDLEELVEAALSERLTERERIVIEERYIKQKTLQVIADALDITRERVRQIEKKSLRKLRRASQIAGMGEMLRKCDDDNEYDFKENLYSELNTSCVGNKWSPEEESRLIDEFNNGLSIAAISRIHSRTKGGIRARLKKLGLIDENGIELRNNDKISDTTEQCNGLNEGLDVNEIVIAADQTPGEAWFYNFNELKEYLRKGLESYNNTEYSIENVEQARYDREILREIKKKLTDKRKEIENAYEMPIEVVLKQLDELIEMVKVPYSTIDRMLKTHSKEIKKHDIMAYAKSIAAVLGEYASKVLESPAFFNYRWCNASYSEKNWKRDVGQIIDDAKESIDYILSKYNDCSSIILGFYFEKLSLDGVDSFIETIIETNTHFASEVRRNPEIVYVDTSTGEIIETIESENKPIKDESRVPEEIISRTVRLTGRAEKIGNFLNTAEFFGVSVEEIHEQ